jgi:hypothetical protein
VRIDAHAASKSNVGNQVTCKKIVDDISIRIKMRCQSCIQFGVHNSTKIFNSEIELGSRKSLHGIVYSLALCCMHNSN